MSRTVRTAIEQAELLTMIFAFVNGLRGRMYASVPSDFKQCIVLLRFRSRDGVKMKENKKTVIITGAGRGIGRASAALFGSKGWNVLIHYHRSADQANRLISELNDQYPGAAAGFQADITQRDQVDEMVLFALHQFGAVDVLVNNAGIGKQTLFTDITPSEWDQMLRVNLTGIFHCTQSVAPSMIRRKSGRIINVSSIWGMVGASCEVHYSAAKAGVIGFTKALAKELGPSNIQVNCVCPGVIQTEMNKDLSAEDLNRLAEETPLMRLGTPDDIARCILFLASEEADFITGQVISPNGGLVI